MNVRQERTLAGSFHKYSSITVFQTLVLLGIILGVVFSSSVTMATEQAELQVLQGNADFTKNMYKSLAKEPGNLIFSPISAHAVLSMAYQGAKGSTKEAFASTLNVPDNKLAAEGYSSIMNRLNNVENVTLHIANKVYLMNNFELQDEFNKVTTDQFKSEVEKVDFGKADETARTINTWVEKKTNDKIKDLISPDSLDSLTRLVLVNAIYFKGNWLEQFDKSRTKTEKFYLNDKDTVDVQMMHQNKKFNYKDDAELNAQIIELPYKNKDLSMIIILPKEKNGITELEKKLQATDLTKITEGMWNTEVDLALPKFKIEKTIDLKDTLTELGLGEIFTNKANLTGMITGNEQLYVSKVLQKAFIEVNEEGAEAAAATAINSMARTAHLFVFKAKMVVDHPFLVLVSTKRDNLILFTGKVANPN